MIGSFRQTVAQWLQASLRADLYVSLPGENMSADKTLADHRLKEKLSELPACNVKQCIAYTNHRR